jgi:hypothetical protein
MKKVLFLSLVLVLAVASGVGATSYSGSEGNLRDSTGTLIEPISIGTQGNSWAGTGGNKNAKGVHMDWTVDDTSHVGNWTYTYTFQVASGALKSIYDFDLSSKGTPNDVISSTLMGYNTYNLLGSGITATYIGPGTYQPAGGPGTISGLQWTFGTAGSAPASYSFVLTLVSGIAPQWGNFIIVGEGTQGAQTMAWDPGLKSNTAPVAIGPGNYAGYEYVMTPGTAPVPIPPSLFLLAGGLGSLGVIRKRWTKR